MADKGPTKAEIKRQLEEEDAANNSLKVKEQKNGWGKNKKKE